MRFNTIITKSSGMKEGCREAEAENKRCGGKVMRFNITFIEYRLE